MSIVAAARERLESLDGASPGEVRRVTFEVEAEGRTELVTVTLQEDASLLVSATDGNASGAHVRAALSLLAGTYVSDAANQPAPNPAPTGSSAESELASAVDDLLLAVVRRGVADAYGTASVDEAIEGILAARKPTPPGIARFVGRLRAELASQNVTTVARILDGASRLVQTLRASRDAKDAKRRLSAWLGHRHDPDAPRETIHERSLVEVGREWISGTERSAFQRRYLVDATNGEILCEERPRTQPGSVGPCPREIMVGLAEVQHGPVPRRVRLLQYAVALDVSANLWDRVAGVGARSVDDLAPRYRGDLKAFPALAEPVALVRAERLDLDRSMLVTPAGDTLALSLAEGCEERLRALTKERTPRWLMGRLDDNEDSQLVLSVLSAGFGGDRPYERLV